MPSNINSPKVSVIIPVYNVEKYLRECLDSVVNQTLKDIEIICIDDKSTDNSLNILKQYSKIDERIKVIEQNINQGQGLARNIGIKNATGEYIMFIDPDDWYTLDTCEKAYNQITKNKNDLVVFNFRSYNEETGEYINCDWRTNPLRKYFSKSNINLKEIENYINCAYTWTQIYSLDFIRKNEIYFSEHRFAEDVPFYIKTLVLANNISVINEYLYFYRVHNKSASLNFLKNWNDLFLVRYDCIKFIENAKDGEYYIYPFLIYAINSLFYWYDKTLRNEFIDLKAFYVQLHNFFKVIAENYDIENIKNYINYRSFKYISKNSWFKCQISKFINAVFSMKNSPDGKHKIISVLGFKISINMYDLLSACNKKIKKNKIVFSNYFGKSYGCNPKYITEEILKRNLPYEIVWLVNEPDKEKQNFPPSIKLVKYNSKQALKELLTAKIWVDNTRKPYFWDKGLKKNSKTKYIQTWHGTLGMKKIEGAIKDENQYWRTYAKIDSKNIDYLLSTSETDKKFMRQSFWYEGEILVSGYPRNDILYSSDEHKQSIKEKVYDFCGIDRNSKFILYVPTFRDDDRTSCFTLDYERIIKTFEKKYNCEYVLGTRFHPHNFNFAINAIEYSEKIKNATVYSDIMELLIAADVIITDYSSCIFDFMHLKRPAFIYAADIEQYENERGFYFPLKDTPFSIAKNNNELVENIEKFNYCEYQDKVIKYMEKNGYADDGHVSERIVDLIESIINDKDG